MDNQIIIGRNAVNEAVKLKKPIDCIYVSNIAKFSNYFNDKSLTVKQVTKEKLDKLADGENHQGVVAICAMYEYSTLEDILAISQKNNKAPFIIICDEIEDPHNFGAIIRTAECCGADGIIIPKRRSASLSGGTLKASAGATVPVCKVSNIVSTIKDLKKQNIWVYGADMDGKMWCEQKYDGGVALVIGSEGNGISRLVKEECDFIVSLPMYGKINSLNASVAGGILMYEVARQRLKGAEIGG
ncbi:MAG: 23S rRNA (guanosine(2251)-2'-O)-methyltransferase RlmB [Oscillospiraceae bacterium]